LSPKVISLAFILLTGFAESFAQVDEARQAIDRGEYVRAATILSAELGQRPSADAYLYLGIAYRHMKEYQKAGDVLNEGSKRYPDDARFHDELANLFLENNDVDAAKTQLKESLKLDANDNFASDQLATIDMSEGEVQSALRSWNKTNRPFINDILHNYYLNFGSWVVRRAVAFNPANTLRYSQWKTTEARLFETRNFSNVGLEIEPTAIPDQYNAVVRTTRKANGLNEFGFNLIKGAPIQTSYLDVWDIGKTGINFNSSYRWQTNRRRFQGGLEIPLPVASLTYLDLGDIWRDERWDVSDNIVPPLLPSARFDNKSNGLYIGVRNIPHYRVQLGAGFIYRNRAASGDLPQIFTNNLNSGVFSAETDLRIADGTYQNQLHIEGFAARQSIIGSAQFTGGVAKLSNRVTLSRDTRTYLDWSLTGGMENGSIPFENYFELGMDSPGNNILRAHTAALHGKYGHGPMGSEFLLLNTDVERRLATIPFFNTLNIPFFSVKWELFADAARTWDRTHVFQPSKLLIDVGGGLRFETPTHSLNLVYGRSLRDGQNVLYGYFERRLW
jgi:tetratricopeptide (TPR) repeat protein